MANRGGRNARRRTREREVDPFSPEFFNVELDDDEYIPIWRWLVHRPIEATRYADDLCTRTLGIHVDI